MRTWTEQTLLDRCEEEGNCLLWKHAVNSAGHPTSSINGGNQLVRRYAYEHIYGNALNQDQRVIATCGSVRCCSRECLVALSRGAALKLAFATLMRDPVLLHRRQQMSVANGFAKLDMQKADAIRASSDTPKVLAARFGVGLNAIYEVRRGKSWRRATASSVFNLGA